MQMTGPEKGGKRRKKGAGGNGARHSAPPDLQSIVSATECTGILPAQPPEELPKEQRDE